LETFEPLSVESIQAGLATQFVGQNVVCLAEVGSTNDTARLLAQEQAPEGSLVVADYQTQGRGRLARRWQAPAGSSLLLSLVFRPPLAPSQVQRLVMVCSLAVADAVEAETGLAVDLKWPNDLLIDGAKAGGILVEMASTGERVEFVIVGIGLNVNLDPAELPQDLLMPATSLSQKAGRQIVRASLLRALLQKIERRYVAMLEGTQPQDEWAGRLVTLGRPVSVSGPGSVLEGVAEGVDADGALLVRRADGGLERVLAGDVTPRKP
jgi:BirA family biotin operon repressor/biotin-[acetyl-CoA-carboxylase] ligase